jgi:hypothetical protein
MNKWSRSRSGRLYSPDKTYPFQLNVRLARPRGRYEFFGSRKNTLSLTGIELLLLDSSSAVAYPGIFFGGGGGGYARNIFRGIQQIQLRTEGRENGDLGTVAP